MIVTPCPNLATLTTLRIGGMALAEIQLERSEECVRLPEECHKWGGQSRCLGGGSNLLVQDGDLPVVLLRPARRLANDTGLVLLDSGPNEALVRVAGGYPLPALLAWCGKQGFSGLEGLVGVPGQMGGAVAMNAGAYGQELGACLREVTVWSAERGQETLGPSQWRCGYRQFTLAEGPKDYMVLEAVLAFVPTLPSTVQERMDANLEAKRRTQPLTTHSAGCVFKNPPEQSAGRLLDEAGMGGFSVGDMWFTDKHANFMANRGAGTFEQALELMERGRQAVHRRFGISLETEVKVWSWQ